jgi:hypothetical protein
MQFSTQTARPSDETGEIRSLHLSLNAPVIAIDELPVGPARAGVALCARPGGRLQLQIAIRSLRTGEVVAVASALDSPDPVDEASAIEAALSYAEGMGFLFDEDELLGGGEGAADKARALWVDLVEDAPERIRASERVAVADAPEPSDPRDGDAAVREVPIHDLGSDAEPIEVEQALAPLGPVETLSIAAPESLLSKFRLVLDGARPGPDALEPEAPTAIVEPPQKSRIRLLSRF